MCTLQTFGAILNLIPRVSRFRGSKGSTGYEPSRLRRYSVSVAIGKLRGKTRLLSKAIRHDPVALAIRGAASLNWTFKTANVVATPEGAEHNLMYVTPKMLKALAMEAAYTQFVVRYVRDDRADAGDPAARLLLAAPRSFSPS